MRYSILDIVNCCRLINIIIYHYIKSYFSIKLLYRHLLTSPALLNLHEPRVFETRYTIRKCEILLRTYQIVGIFVTLEPISPKRMYWRQNAAWYFHINGYRSLRPLGCIGRCSPRASCLLRLLRPARTCFLCLYAKETPTSRAAIFVLQKDAPRDQCTFRGQRARFY